MDDIVAAALTALGLFSTNDSSEQERRAADQRTLLLLDPYYRLGDPYVHPDDMLGL